MSKFHPFLRWLLPFGLVAQILWIITSKESLWLFALAFILLACGVTYGMVRDWKAGNKGAVRTQLIVGGMFLLAIGITLAVRHL
jgi:hypothetical protein